VTDTATLCESCDGTGWTPIAPAKGERVTRCSCVSEHRPKAAPGVPIEFQDARLATFTESPANRAARQFAPKWLGDVTGRDLYVFGNVGSGKTRLACSLLNEAHQAGTAGFFARVPMFLLRLQPSDVEQAELFRRACDVPLLVLDDLGSERETATDFTRRTLLILYEERHDHGRRTIWTSNQSLVEIGEFMQDERLASRIKGQADVVELNGADWRMGRRR
jgi:DNA replication protein DnaC